MKNKKFFFIIFSAASFLSSLILYYNARTFLSDSIGTEAVIIQDNNSTNKVCNDNMVSYSIKLTAEDGRIIHSSLCLSPVSLLKIGDKISVLYNKNNPEIVSISHSWKITYFSKAILLFCLSLIFDLAAFRIK